MQTIVFKRAFFMQLYISVQDIADLALWWPRTCKTKHFQQNKFFCVIDFFLFFVFIQYTFNSISIYFGVWCFRIKVKCYTMTILSLSFSIWLKFNCEKKKLSINNTKFFIFFRVWSWYLYTIHVIVFAEVSCHVFVDC